MLRQLQQLIVDCQSHGAQGIIGKLRGILNGSRHPANHVPPPPLQPPASRPGQGKGKGKGDKSPLVAPKPPKNVGGPQSKGGGKASAKPAVPPPKLNQVWWPGRVGSLAKVGRALDAGDAPDADILLTSYAEACKLKVIASTHSITCLFALVCFDLPAPLPEGWSHKWVQLHTGEWRQACVAALSGTLPQWGKEPHLAQCPQDLAVQEAQTTLRAVWPQEFLSAADWKEAQSKPQRLVAKLLPENLWARSYGWHAETREACIVGFLKVPSQACDQVLQASGERGVFFSAVRDKNTPAPSGVRWLPRDDKVTAEVYLQTAQKQAAVAAAPLAFRRGGGLV